MGQLFVNLMFGIALYGSLFVPVEPKTRVTIEPGTLIGANSGGAQAIRGIPSATQAIRELSFTSAIQAP